MKLFQKLKLIIQISKYFINSNLNMNQFLNERSFDTPSLTPMQKFKSDLPPSVGRLGPQSQGQTLILNINGTTNINNFHSGPTHGPSASLQNVERRQPQKRNGPNQNIQGRKGPLPEPHLKVADDQEVKKNMLPKKLLKQAKSAKNARITPKCIMQKTLKAAQLELQTGRVQQNKSQFDFNFKKRSNATNATIEYDQKKRKSGLQQALGQNKTQNITVLQQKVAPSQTKTAKSTRSMAQTKQSKSLSKRTKPEGKKMQMQTNRPKTMINNLLNTQKQRAMTSGMRKNGTINSTVEVEKENVNAQNHSKNLSISSFSSREKQGQDAIANELSKNYFLNSKQLLNHLSPTREFQIAQANTNLRGRTKSIAVTSNAPKPVQKRKNHSQSQSRSNQQQLTTTRVTKPSMTATSRQENDLDVRALKKVQAQALGNKTLAPQNKKAVDKLIKDNIRKNKHKQDEQEVKKQLEQYRQQQRKADLSQRNQEVRMINASKIINQVTGGNDMTIQAQSPVGSQRRQTSAKDTANKRRSRSCFDYQALRKNAVNSGTSHSGSRRAHHSQENKNQYMNLQVNQPEDTNSKPISFVNEITKLTQMIEHEIGGPSNRAYNTTKSVPKVEPKKIKKSRPSVEIQRFIEKKKREDHIKKSLEQTIEHEKQIKINQNLNTLDKYIKKGKLKSKSIQGKEGSRPKSIKTKSLTRKHKRSNGQQDQAQIVGLSEIFYQNYKEDTSPFRNDLRNQTPSAMDEPSIYAQTQQTQQYGNKNSNFNSGKQSFVSTSQNYPRKTQNQSVSYQTGPSVEVPHHTKKALNKSFVPPKTRSMERPPQLEKKHPALQQKSPKSNEQIRRIHEFVALYKKRCVLKPGVSDATVMGTLHSAASVIQIHFRYYKRLRDAGLVRKPRLDDVSSFINSEIEEVNKFNQVQRMDRIDISHIESAEQSDYINTTEKRRESEATVQNEDYWAPSGADHYQQAFNQRASLDGQVIGSVFSGSGTISGQQTLMPSPEYIKKEIKKQPVNKRPSLDIKLIEESNNQYHQSVVQPSSAQGIDSQNSVQGLKTPIQVPGLDLGQLKKKQEKAKEEQKQLKQSVYQDDQDNKIQPSPGSQDPAQTTSSYSGIFNRLALPLPRSARVKVEYSLVQKDPMIKAQLKEIVEHKNKRGKEIMKQGLRDKLITERTYEKNRLKLEKWVGASYNKIEDNQASRRSKIATNEELMQEAVNGRARLQKIINVNEERQSARSGFPSNRSAKQNLGYLQYPGNGENYTDRDPYKDAAIINQNAIGSGRLHKSKLVELINRDSSRTSSKAKRDQSSSTSLKKQVEISNSYRNDEARIEDIDLNIEGPNHENPNVSFEERHSIQEVTIQKLVKDARTHGPMEDRSQQSSPLDNIRQLKYGDSHQQTDKSLNRSQSYQTIPKDNISESIDNLNHNSAYDEDQSNKGVVHPDQIELQLEDALRHEQQKTSPDQSSIEALRDPSFFLRQVDEGEPSHLKNDNSVTQNISEEKTKDQTSYINDTTMDRERPFGNSSYMESSVTKSPQTNHKLIKVENQQYDDPHSLSDAVDDSPPRVGQKKHQNITVEIESEASVPVVPISPVSENPIGFESKIQTGAHSLSSTDSDMAKAIHAAHRESYESPPDVISPKSIQGEILIPGEQYPQTEQDQLADQMTDYLLQQLLAEVNHDMDIMIPRTNLARQKNSIKFFEKKGIKTDLFAIEKYVDEVLEEVKVNRPEFMVEINKPLSQNAQQALFQMQNSEIGTYEHFQVTLPPVLSLDLYLKLEKRRKESRELASQQSPDGRFDFEKVNDEDLQEDGVDKNFLAECQHIHNKVLFDCINDSLSQFRPHGKDGAPMAWSRLSRKLKPTEDFTLEEMFEITKHDLFRMAIMQAGTLPRREFVFGGHFDEDLFAEIREKKLATLLCREIVDNEPQWLKWDFEEAQTKIDIADMVLESLVTETIGFLTQKSKEVNSAQAEFEKIEQMLKSKS